MNEPLVRFPDMTESLCPQCLKRIPAVRIRKNGDIYLRKTCPDHGTFETVVWRGRPTFDSWNFILRGGAMQTKGEGCPFECGLCAHHLRESCCVLLEVTQRCDRHCPVCFADAGKTDSVDPSLDRIRQWFQILMSEGGPFNIQFSGGEPTLRDDLSDIIAVGRSLGFSYFQVNTNGLRIARDSAYLAQMKDAGL